MKDILTKLLFLFLFETRVKAEEIKVPSLEEITRLFSTSSKEAVEKFENEGVKVYIHNEKSKHRGLYKFLNENFKDKKSVIVYGYCDNLVEIKKIIDNTPDDPKKEMIGAYLSFLYSAKELKDSDTGFVFVYVKDFSEIKPRKWKDLLFFVEVFKYTKGIKLGFSSYIKFRNGNWGYSFESVIDHDKDTDLVKKIKEK